MRSPLRIVRVCSGLAVAELSNICIVVWREPVNRVRFDTQREGLAEVIARHPERTGFLCVIEPTAEPPNDELRRASAEMVRVNQPGLRCIACVVEGGGFKNAIARSALSAIALMLGTREVPFSVFGTVAAATTLMAPLVDVRDADAIAKAVETVRSEL